jgi:hypothetical protein
LEKEAAEMGKFNVDNLPGSARAAGGTRRRVRCWTAGATV